MGFLDDIIEKRLGRIEASKKERSPFEVADAAACVAPSPSFRQALSKPGTSLIAECKKASPSKGLLVEDYHPGKLALDYERAGASAVSVLTEEDFFQGSLSHVQEVRFAAGIPVLRKDFVLDSYQIYEAKVAGASAVLLIARILSDQQLSDFISLAKELGVDALVEVHSQPELQRALVAGADIIGINNRDLDSFHVDLGTSLKLAPEAKSSGALVVAESGITRRDDVLQLEKAGVDAILVGESIVTNENPGTKIRELLGA